MHLPRHVAWYLICFMIGAALGLVPILIVEVLEKTNDSAAATIVAIMREMQAAVVISGAFSFITVEGITMLAEIFLRNREEKGRQEGIVEGLEKGHEKGLVEGIEKGHEKGLVEGIEKGSVDSLMEARQRIASRLESMTAEESTVARELLAEIDQLIEEARNRRGK